MRLFVPAAITVFILFTSVVAQAQFTYINPVPGSQMKNPETGIILKTGTEVRASSLKADLISLTGNLSGNHACSVKLAHDGKTILITPLTKFKGGETVTVTVKDGMLKSDGTLIHGTTFSFQTHAQWTPAQQQAIADARRQIRIDEYGEAAYHDMFESGTSSANKLTCEGIPPFIIQSTPGAFYDEPVIYCNQRIINNECQTMTIISSAGDSIYSYQDDSRGIDFKINDNGYITFFDVTDSSFAMIDSVYNLVKKFYMGNGYHADEHEFRVYPDGTALMLCYDIEIVDMTAYGGQPNAQVTGLIIQKLDADGNVIFEWSSWDHIAYEESNQPLTNLIIDLIHGNSLDLDDDGNLLLSSRHLDEITKIDLSTGDIIWRMGGEANQFTFINETSAPKPFSYQHHFRRIGNGVYSMFDNGNNQVPERGTAKEYLIDEVNKTATLIWHYNHPQVNGKEIKSVAMGSVELLPNGNRFIDWGMRAFVNLADIPNFTEVDSSGNIVWEFWFTDSNFVSYRAFKKPWDRCNLVLPSAMLTDSITTFSADLTWNYNSKVSSYVLQYKKCSETDWTSISLNDTNYTLQGLDENTCYQWRILTVCEIYDDSFYTEIQQFNTKNPLGIASNGNELTEVKLTPNPATSQTTLTFGMIAGGVIEMNVMNLLGDVLQQIQFNAQAGFNKKELDLSSLAAGTYIVTVKSDGSAIRKKLVVN